MAEPWDLLRGRDVFTHKPVLKQELDAAIKRDWAPNCSTFSRAREKPIPGVKFPPKPLRNDPFPKGIPNVLEKLQAAKERKLDLDTSMAEMAARDCIKSHHTLTGSSAWSTLAIPLPGDWSPGRGLKGWREFTKRSAMHACLEVVNVGRRKFLYITSLVSRQRLVWSVLQTRDARERGSRASLGDLW